MRRLPTRMIRLQRDDESASSSEDQSSPAAPPTPTSATTKFVSAQEGLESLLGQSVLIFCANYIYTGKLTGVNDACIQLEDASIVYETGAFDAPGYKDAQRLPTSPWYIALSSMESYGVGK